MAKEKYYKSAEGPEVIGASRSPQDVTAAELMSSFGANPSRESLRVLVFQFLLKNLRN